MLIIAISRQLFIACSASSHKIPSESSQLQEIVWQISDWDYYYIRLKVTYTSNVFGANRVCKISRTYRLERQQHIPELPSKDETIWKAREKTRTIYQD